LWWKLYGTDTDRCNFGYEMASFSSSFPSLLTYFAKLVGHSGMNEVDVREFEIW
jgi:hypothetical protein